MPHGTPDWGLVGPKATVFGLDDLGEHAVRLGSPHLWDRRGDVVWMTDFRNGMGDARILGSGAGNAISLWTGHTRQGAYCVQMQAGSDLDHWAEFYKVLPLPVASGVGVEFSFSVGTPTDDWEVHINWDTGARWWETAARFDYQNDRLEYLDAGGLWVEIEDDFNLRDEDSPMHVMKLVVNVNLEHYMRVILDDQVFSLMGIGARDRGVVAQRDMYVLIYHHSVEGKIAWALLDNVIVTQNEP